MAVTLPHDFSTKTGIISGTEVQEQYDALAAKFSSNIVNDDIADNAGIAYTKLQTMYQVATVQASIGGTAGIATGYNAQYQRYGFLPPVYDNKGSWTLSHIEWICSDVGATNNIILTPEFGYFTGAGAWSALHSLPGSVTITRAVDNAGNQGYSAAIDTQLNDNARLMRINITNIGTNAMSANTDFLIVTAHLYRRVYG